MHRDYGYLGEQYRSLDDLSGYTIEKGDPDPRGWTVTGPDGNRLGKVDDLIVDTQSMKVRYFVVAQDRETAPGSGEAVLDARNVEVDSRSHQVIARDVGTGVPRSASADVADIDRTRDRDTQRERSDRMTLSEEELTVGKRQVQRGEVRIGKHVETEHVQEPVTLRREEVTVERRPVQARDRTEATFSEDEVRIPVTEEEAVIEKRPVVKEEVVIGKRTVEERETVEADLKRERVDIEREGERSPSSDPATRPDKDNPRR